MNLDPDGVSTDETALTRYFIGVSADRPMEVQFTEADGPGGGFYEAPEVDALIARLRAALAGVPASAAPDDGGQS